MNSTNITLIPKTNQPNNLNSFRPISLCTVTYRVFSKILTNRFKSILQNTISPSQNAFLKGGQITDNTLIVNETMKHLRK